MASYIRSVADALANGLALAASTQGAVVSRTNWPDIDNMSLSQPSIYVMPGDLTVSKLSFNSSQLDISAAIFVGKKVSVDSQVDSVMDLADAVLLLIRAHDWPDGIGWPEGSSGPIEVSTQLNPDDGLNERNIWKAIITPTYRYFSLDAIE